MLKSDIDPRRSSPKKRNWLEALKARPYEDFTQAIVTLAVLAVVLLIGINIGTCILILTYIASLIYYSKIKQAKKEMREHYGRDRP